MRDYIIPEGKHDSTFWPRMWVDESMWDVKGQFLVMSDYDLGNRNQFDWNKLYGVGYGFNHHKNSARWGWRYNTSSGLMELTPYCYVNGKRVASEHPTLWVRMGQKFSLSIVDTGLSWKFWYGVDEYNADREGEEIMHSPKLCRFGFKLDPYFGGQEVAPHQINIRLDW